jgi:hypothetical protein
VITLGTLGAGCVAAQGSRVAGAVVSSVQALEAASAVNSISSGVSDMATNGVTLGNAVETGMGVLTIVGLKATTCFTAGTQVVVDDKIRGVAYFTETSEPHTFDEVNILFAFAGISCAVIPTAISLKKRNRKKSKISQIQNKLPQDGLICEIDETEYQFSLRKWILLPLLIIATIICGYFALPTTKTVAVTKSVEQVRQGYVTKNIEDIQIGDEVFAYDVTTGKTSKCKVTDTFERTSDHLRYLTTVGKNNLTQTFETTDSHPFWVVNDKPDLSRTARETVEDNGTILRHENIEVTKNGYYVEAKDLKVGDTFIGASNEVSILVTTQRKEFSEGITVYNFTVEDNHNYFVISNYDTFAKGARPVLVHNALNYEDVPVYRGGSSLKPREGIDVKVRGDNLIPAGRGVSVRANPNGLAQYGGSFRVKSIPDELEIVRVGLKEGHYEIAPKIDMTLERYEELLKKVVLTPQ